MICFCDVLESFGFGERGIGFLGWFLILILSFFFCLVFRFWVSLS